MAENINRIGSDGGPTREYSDVTAWEAATDIDLSITGNIEVGELYADTDFTDNDIIEGATGIDASTYRILRAASGERHDGAVANGGVEFNPSIDGHILVINEDNFRIDGLIMGNCTGDSDECCRINNTGFRATHCICYNQTVESCDGFYTSTNDLVLYTSNCIFYNIDRGAVNMQGPEDTIWFVHNCTGWNLKISSASRHAGFGLDTNTFNDGSVMHCDNVTSHAANQEAFRGGGSGSPPNGIVRCTNCASADTSISTGTEVVDVADNIESITQADQFADLTGGTEDLRLKAGADLLVAGIDLSADSDLPVTDDIEYNTRVGTYDIGAHQLSAPAGGETFTATVAVTTGGVSCSSTATFVAPIFSATAGLTTGGASLSATATHTAPTFDATAALTTGGATLTASAVFTSGEFTATAALLTGGSTLSASATFTAPVFDATASLTTGGVSLTASASFTTVTRTATADLTTGGSTFTASATFTAPTRTATATLVTGGAQHSSSATFTAPVFDATASLTTAGSVLAASATFTAPIFDATASLLAGGSLLVASATFTAPIFDATADLITGGSILAASATFVAPVFDATASLTVGPALIVASAIFSEEPIFLASVAVTTGGVILSATAEFTAAFVGSATLLAGAAELTASATFVAPIFDATADLTVGGSLLVASATFIPPPPPQFIATVAVTAGASTLVATAIFSEEPIFLATVSVTTGGSVLQATATFTPSPFKPTLYYYLGA